LLRGTVLETTSTTRNSSSLVVVVVVAAAVVVVVVFVVPFCVFFHRRTRGLSNKFNNLSAREGLLSLSSGTVSL